MNFTKYRTGRPPRQDTPERTRICLRLKEATYTKARAEARKLGLPVGDVIEKAIENFLEKTA